jgi:hypothetical protein
VYGGRRTEECCLPETPKVVVEGSSGLRQYISKCFDQYVEARGNCQCMVVLERKLGGERVKARGSARVRVRRARR